MPIVRCSLSRRRSFSSTQPMTATTSSGPRSKARSKFPRLRSRSPDMRSGMELQKVAVKIFSQAPDSVPLTDFIDVFHRWIQATEGIYHDVADYSHMRAGPGIVLVANAANVAIDETGNRRGLLFTQKAAVKGANSEILRSVLRAALENCRKLENEPSLKGELKFSGQEVSIIVNDRLVGANTDAAFAEMKPEIDALGRDLFGGAPFTVERDCDRRK